MKFQYKLLYQLLRLIEKPLGGLVMLLARATWPSFLVHAFIRYFFIKKLKVNLAEAERDKVKEYTSALDFFTRSLKKEVRPLSREALAKETIISPVDGLLSAWGIIGSDLRDLGEEKYWVKGKAYSLEALAGAEYKRYIGGSYMVFYLSPKDYHRIHAPMDARLSYAELMPGRRLPVNNFSLNSFDEVFGKNKRLRLTFSALKPDSASLMLKAGQAKAAYEEQKQEKFQFMSIWVSALNVGGFETKFDTLFLKRVQENGAKAKIIDYRDAKEDGLVVKKAEDLGAFELGSSVVMLFPAACLQTGSSDISKTPRQVCMGDVIARQQARSWKKSRQRA